MLRVRWGSRSTLNERWRRSASWRNGRDDRLDQVGEVDLLRIDRDRSRFDLGQIEDVADEVHEVGARAMDGARELHLLVGQVAVGVVAELLAQNEDAVERRAQLVRHVGQEFGLVLRGERQLRRLLLQRAAGLLDLLVLGFHLDVALGELLRLLLELLVGLLQLLLLGLQLAGELLRLREQRLRLHRRLDAVEHDADAGGELLEEGQVRGIEIVQRRQRDHGLDLVLEDDREDQEAARHRVEQHRADADGIGGNIGHVNAPLLDRALPDEAFAEVEARRDSRRGDRRRIWRAASDAALPSASVTI